MTAAQGRLAFCPHFLKVPDTFFIMRTGLNSLCVVVTRPAGQGRELADLIRSAGGRAIEFPTLKIAAVPTTSDIQRRVKQLSKGDWAIFISANAAKFGSRLINDAKVDIDLIKIISIGGATSTALNQCDIHVDLECPQPTGTESLLAMPDMQKVREQRIFIFRGIGGRGLLGQTLSDRGASIQYIECYERRRPDSDCNLLCQAQREGKLDVMVTTSVDGLQNLIKIIGEQGYDHLLNTRLVVIGERQLVEAKRLGWQ